MRKLATFTDNQAFDSLANGLALGYASPEYRVSFEMELNNLKSKQIRILNKCKDEKEAIYYRMVKDLGSKEAFSKLKENHHNQSIANIVLDKMNYKKIMVYQDEIIQLKDPIFKYPQSTYGRAHFYAPLKLTGNYKIETYWFNLCIIWISSLMMYILLQLDLIRKGVENIEILKVAKGWSKKILRV